MTTIEIRPEVPTDIPVLTAMATAAFGPGRFARSAYRVREGVAPVSELSLTACRDGEIAGGVRFTAVRIGEHDGGLLLGPLVVDPDHMSQGCGSALLKEGLARARDAGFTFVLLVGDAPYYGRFGFKPCPLGAIRLPGPVDPQRLLAVELSEGGLDGVSGVVMPHAPRASVL